MNKVYCGSSGTSLNEVNKKISDLPISPCLINSLIDYFGDDVFLRPAQDQAIFSNNLLDLRTNIILCTPTNSGKSLLSYLGALREALKGHKAILVEPLRVLAHEKAEELKQLSELIHKHGGPKLKVTLTTGDYRLNDELYSDKPNEDLRGELVIATPERLDAISRVKENLNWFNNVTFVCIDEAHLLGDSQRGATLEMLITFLKSLKMPPQTMLLSASIGNPDEISKWLNPCKIITFNQRYPELEKYVYELEEGENTDSLLIDEVHDILEQKESNILIFVYRTDSAEQLARQIAKSLGGVSGNELVSVMNQGVGWYHSKMSLASRNIVRQGLLSGKVRVIVSTSALAMGVNLPTSHVIIRDLTFPGVKHLSTAEIMQMLGRAGRGNKNGVGVVFFRETDKINKLDFEDAIRSEIYPNINSQFHIEEKDINWRTKDVYNDRRTHQIIGIIHRIGPTTISEIQSFLKQSWGGRYLIPLLDEQLMLLIRWKLVYFNDEIEQYSLTRLGQASSRCYLPALAAANIGQVIRDLIQDKSDGDHLLQMKPIDLIILMCLTTHELKPVIRYSKQIETYISNYMESLPIFEKSYLYRQWISTDPFALYGSIRVDNNKINDKDASKEILKATYLAMLIYDLSKGKSPQELNPRYNVDVQEIEEKLRDTTLWLLSSLEKILEVKNFYFHLKSVCDASFDETRKVERSLKQLKGFVFALLPNLKYKSSLGQLIRGVNKLYPNAKSHPGEASIKRLEENGIHLLVDLLDKTPNDLIAFGLSKSYADMICGYIRRRRV